MYILPIISALLLVAADQMSKFLAAGSLAPAGSVPVIEGVLSFTYVLNDGAAFGLFAGGRWFFVLFSVLVVVVLGYYYVKLPKGGVYRWIRLSLVLICAGAIGNFIDRIRTGQVVDFIHATFIDFPVFNIADIYVVVGSLLLGVLVVFFVREGEDAPAEQDGGGLE